jgi:hypothetical protein
MLCCLVARLVRSQLSPQSFVVSFTSFAVPDSLNKYERAEQPDSNDDADSQICLFSVVVLLKFFKYLVKMAKLRNDISSVHHQTTISSEIHNIYLIISCSNVASSFELMILLLLLGYLRV